MNRKALTKSFLLVLALVVFFAAIFSVWFVVADHTVFLNSDISNGSTWLKGGTNYTFNFTFGSTVANTSTNLTQVNISNANFTLNLTSPTINISGWSCTAFNASLINCSGTNQSISMNITIFAELPTSYEINHSWVINTRDNYTDTNTTGWLTEVDAVDPYITVTYPANNSNISSSILNITGTVTDATIGSVAINETIFGSNTGTFASWNFTNITMEDGDYCVNITATDAALNKNSTIICFKIDASNPAAAFGTNPVDDLNLSATSDVFEFECIDSTGISQIKMFSNISGTWEANYTDSSYTSSNQLNITMNFSDGYYTWAVWCNDTSGNEDWTDTNRTFTIDTVAPAVTLHSPVDGHSTSSSTKTFIYRVTDAWEITSCEFIFDGSTDQTDTTIAKGVDQEFTKSSMGAGAHTWTVKCTDKSTNSHTATAFNIRVMTSGGGGGGGSGSGGGSVGAEEEEEELPEAPNQPTEFDYDLGNLTDYEENFTELVNVTPNQTIRFVVKGVEHTAQVDGITNDSIIVWIWSEPVTAKIFVGETENFDLDLNEMNELTITLNSVEDGKATLQFREIEEVAPSIPSEEARNWWWLLWVAIGILVIVAVILIVFAVQKSKKYKYHPRKRRFGIFRRF